MAIQCFAGEVPFLFLSGKSKVYEIERIFSLNLPIVYRMVFEPTWTRSYHDDDPLGHGDSNDRLFPTH